jgi:hypothetical protein
MHKIEMSRGEGERTVEIIYLVIETVRVAVYVKHGVLSLPGAASSLSGSL